MSNPLPQTTEAQLEAAKDMIRELQTAMLSVQRSAFDAGYDAGKEGRVREWAYKEWSHTMNNPDITREEIAHLNGCIKHAMLELREAVSRDVFRTQTDFVGRIQQVTCEVDDLFDQKSAAELDGVEFSERDELDEKLMALASLCVACAVLCREEPVP